MVLSIINLEPSSNVMMARPPPWLDQSFLQSTVQQEFDSKVVIDKFTLENAAPSGTNYMSDTIRAKIIFNLDESPSTLRTTQLIIKIPITSGYVQELSDKEDFYSKEPIFYNELLPRMTVKLGEEIGPKSYKCLVKGGLVLKDLKEEGYEMVDRISQLDFSHCRETFVAMAKFHACSVACYHENPDLIVSLSKEFFYTKTGPLGSSSKAMLENAVRSVAAVSKNIGCDAFSNLLLSKVDSLFDTCSDFFKPQPNGLNVLVHGDLWTANLLFKHNDSGEAIGVKLIDYQLTRFMTPVWDLLYFMWCSANEEVLEHFQDELYDVYLKTLNFYLKKLGCSESLTKQELMTELNASSDLALLSICNLLPFFMADPDEFVYLGGVNSEDLEAGNKSHFQKLYTGKHFISLLPKLTKQFLNFFYP